MYKYLSILLFFLISCEKEYNEKPSIKPSKNIVVEGILTNEKKEQLIKLTFPIDSFNAIAKPVSGAIVNVIYKYGTIVFSENPTQKGYYYSKDFQGVIGIKYTLKISYLGQNYEAEASMIPLATKDSFIFKKEGALYQYVQLFSEDPIMIELYYDWTSMNSTSKNKKAQEYLYTLTNVDINKSFAPDKEKILVPEGTRIVKRRHSLTREHQEFLRSLLMETEWSGGVFDVQKANVNTNISNGGLGFFAACTVVTDTLIVK